MIAAIFDIIVIICVLYVIWKLIDRYITRANIQEAMEKADEKIQVIKGTRDLFDKRRELRNERDRLRQEQKMYNLETENLKLKREKPFEGRKEDEHEDQMGQPAQEDKI